MTTQAEPTVSATESLQDPLGRPLEARDLKRMQGKPFETRVPPAHQQTRDQLKGYRPPLGKAYVLFEKWNIEIVGEAERVLTYSLFPLSVDDRPEQYGKIERFVRKGYRLLHWGNFYELTDPKKERAQKAQAHNNAWAELNTALVALVENPNVLLENQQLKDEKAALQQKLKEQQELLARLTSEPDGKTVAAAKKSAGEK